MIVARKKRAENVSEYILYMFRVEDIVRALNYDTNAIQAYVAQNYAAQKEVSVSEITDWYLSIRDQLLSHIDEGITTHINEVNELLTTLQSTHEALLKQPVQHIYSALYYKTLPAIIQLRSLSAPEHQQSEIETCFVGIYGFLTLRMKGEEVGEETLAAIKQISTFLAMLADRFCEVEASNIPLS